VTGNKSPLCLLLAGMKLGPNYMPSLLVGASLLCFLVASAVIFI
jgi:hypothetical protein